MTNATSTIINAIINKHIYLMILTLNKDGFIILHPTIILYFTTFIWTKMPYG